MRIRHLVWLGGISAVLVRCGGPPIPTFTLQPLPGTIDDQGQATQIAVRVQDKDHHAVPGTVTLTSEAGDLDGQGPSAGVTMDSAGAGSVAFRCTRSTDPQCTGPVRIEGRWEHGADFLVDVTRVTVNPPDGGAGDAG